MRLKCSAGLLQEEKPHGHVVVIGVVLQLRRTDLVPRFRQDVGTGDEVIDPVVLDELVFRVFERVAVRELQFERTFSLVQDSGKGPGDGAGRRFVRIALQAVPLIIV